MIHAVDDSCGNSLKGGHLSVMQLVHIDQLLADHDHKRQEIKYAPRLVAIAGITAGAALLAAGVAIGAALISAIHLLPMVAAPVGAQ